MQQELKYHWYCS